MRLNQTNRLDTLIAKAETKRQTRRSRPKVRKMRREWN